MPRKFLGACLFAGSCLAIAAAAMFKTTPNDPVSVPVAYSRMADAASENVDALAGRDDQIVVGLRSDRLALPPATPPAAVPLAAAPQPASTPSPEIAAQAQFSNAQAMASPADIEPETATPRRHHVEIRRDIETRQAVRHRVRSHAVTRLPETAKTDAPEKDKTAQVACANGNGFLRALNLAPACN